MMDKQWIVDNADKFVFETEFVQEGTDSFYEIALTPEIITLLKEYSLPRSRRRIDFYCFGKEGKRLPVKTIALNKLQNLSGFEVLFTPSAFNNDKIKVPIKDIRDVDDFKDTVEGVITNLIKLTADISNLNTTTTINVEG